VTDRRSNVAIVGAGVAGIGLGIRLRRQGHYDFTILEQADDVGGVWRDNVYPGVACDIPSNLYSYSFLPPHDWSRFFGTGAEIHDYLRTAAKTEGLLEHIRLRTAMRGARWDERTRRWDVTTPDGSQQADVLVLAAGRLTAPRLPTATGLVSFSGRTFHSSAWDDRSLRGLRVGVVGTGASAVQLLPHVARTAAHTVVFQRTPTWVLPRGDRAFEPGEPRPSRDDLAAEAERLFEARVAGSDAAAALRARSLDHLGDQVADAEMRAVLTPSYEIGCKRAVFSDEYYPTLQRADVTLEASALDEVGPTWARAASGARYELDVLIFATGFDTAHQPYAPLVAGRDGETLAEHWSSGMTSHASIAVTGFPNLFVLDGPNATLGHHSAFEVIEGQVDYVLGALDHLATSSEPLEVTPAAEAAYTSLIDNLAARTVWMQGGCDSWYLHPVSGRLSLDWPGRADEFRRRNGHFDPAPFR
jgi:cation diffusion facilitator CzcD-associated flavoprotein CzcO